MSGLIHLYHGEGKGKTTCAMGLALRAAGHHIPVVIAQFLKSESTGERAALRQLPSVTLLPLPRQTKFTFTMTEEERQQESARSLARLESAFQLANPQGGLLILDEICAALSTGMVPLARLLELLDSRNPKLEVVLTGRNPPGELLDSADYSTEFTKLKHPYDQGISARPGVEF